MMEGKKRMRQHVMVIGISFRDTAKNEIAQLNYVYHVLV